MMNQRGMTIVEALIGVALLMIAIFLSLSIYSDLNSSQIFSEKSLNIIVARNRVLTQLIDSKTWVATTTAAENTPLNCLLKQNNTAVVDRDCSTGSHTPINIYSLDQVLVFNLQQANLGIDPRGTLCGTYNSTTPDMNCPVGFDFEMLPLCDPAFVPDCLNPLFRLNGKFKQSSVGAPTIQNIKALNFSLLATGLYCPTQDPNVGLIGDPQINVTATQVVGITSATQIGHFAQTSPVVLPCREGLLEFKIDSDNYDTTKVGNQTVVCIADESDGTCGYSFVHKMLADGTYSYDVLDGATVVSTKPTWLALNGSENYAFSVLNGLVKFCVDDRCLHIFEKKLSGPFRMRMTPAWSSTAGLPIVDDYAFSFQDL